MDALLTVPRELRLKHVRQATNSCLLPRQAHSDHNKAAVLDDAIHVAFLDDRKSFHSKTITALRTLRTMHETTITIHLIVHFTMHAVTTLPWVDHVHPVLGSLRSQPVACLHRRMASSCHSVACPSYLYKPLLHFLLPAHVHRLLVLDHDTVVVRPLSQLWNEFERFHPRAVIGLVREQNDIYDPLRGFNGGVQLLDLERMRKSKLYNRMLDWHASGNSSLASGRLGDQTVYTILAHYQPLLIHTLSCEWNRQLAITMTRTSYHVCPYGCAILHTNYGLQRVGRAMNQANAT